VQVDRDKVLYLDGSKSYSVNANSSTVYKYIWTLEGFANVTLPSQSVLTLPPDSRAGFNTAGKYYIYYLVVQVGSTLSLPTKITVQISPEPHPDNCVNVTLKDINTEQLITYTFLPLL
jgi:hypothetical protein